MKKFSYFIVIFFSFLISNAQNFPWAKSANGGGPDEGTAVAIDASGNTFVTGFFSSPTIVFGTYTLTNTALETIFIVKYDPSGNVLWAKSGAGGISQDRAFSVCTDPSGNSFITGYFLSPSVTFGTYTITNGGAGWAVYLVKFDPTGNVLWAKSAGGWSQDLSYGVSCDPSGNVFMTGQFSSAMITFGTFTLTSGGWNTIFITKYDPNGNVLWAKNAGGTGNDCSTAISIDGAGNSYITGYFWSSSITFGTYTLTNVGCSDLFIVKYDPNGNVLWANNSGGLSCEGSASISSDAVGNTYITGGFNGTSNLIFGTYTLSNVGVQNMFVAKYDTNGNVIWAKSAGGTGGDGGSSISTYTGGVFVTGYIGSPTIIFGTNTLTPIASAIDPMFIAEYDLNGNVICATSLVSGGDDQNGVCTDKFGNAYIAGDFMANPFIVGTNTLTMTGGEAVFLAKFNCQSTVDIQNLNKILISKVFPNPNNGSFKLQFDKEVKCCELFLINSFGQRVFEQKIIQGENNINTSSLSKGLYHYILLDDNHKIDSGKMAIE